MRKIWLLLIIVTKSWASDGLSLNFQEIEVRAALQIIAEFTGLNIVVSDAVSGNITLKLADVPPQRALEMILKVKGLSQRQEGNILLIGPQEEMVARETLTSVQLELNYAKAQEIATLLKTDKNSLLSPRGSVTIDARTNTLLLQDTPEKLAEIKALVLRLDKPVRQVLIESRIVYAMDNFQESLGVRWGTRDKDFSLNASLGFTVASLPQGTILDLELQALESEGLGKIVASPRLITANQQQAYIESGQEIPYQEATSNGGAAIAFKKAVLRLEVTPQITADNRIIMDLKVNQDSPGVITNGVPAINTREMHTRVLVGNGETIVLGGIYQQTINTQKDKLLLLNRIPVIGRLFGHASHTTQRNELMIFVTPKIL